MEWTAAEMDEARSIVARLTNAYDSSALVAGAGNGDTRHDHIVRELQAWFPWRTMDQLMSHPDFCFRIYKLFNKLLIEFILTVH
uniref:HTH 3-helical bundle domain-containing protein n=1 Tax=Oryza sativa subsp. japonica TaxID=39947 RepID=Q5SNB5_ORYSJ|nr:hypothetical protein [Oryza sativa Japonica Group]